MERSFALVGLLLVFFLLCLLVVSVSLFTCVGA